MKHVILRLFLVIIIISLIEIIIRLDKSWWVLFSWSLGYFYCFANGLINEKFSKGPDDQIQWVKTDGKNKAPQFDEINKGDCVEFSNDGFQTWVKLNYLGFVDGLYFGDDSNYRGYKAVRKDCFSKIHEDK